MLLLSLTFPISMSGSCGLEYHLVNTNSKSGSSESFSRLDKFFVFITLGVLALILYQIWSQRRTPNNVRGRGNGGGGGGGGGWGWFRQTPHYDPPPPYSSKPDGAAGPSSTGGYNPGFFGGMGLAGLGYLAGRYFAPQASSSRQNEAYRDRAYNTRARGREQEDIQHRERLQTDDDGWERVPRSFGGSSASDRQGGGSSSSLGAMRSSTGYGVTTSR